MNYTTIVADPPWPYKTPGQIGASLEHRPNRDKTLGAGNAGSKCRYGQMSVESICGIRVPSADNAHLYLWFTNTFAVEAHVVAKEWGFRPMTILTWVKTRQSDGQPSMKMGYYFRGATEHVLFAVKGSLRLRTKRALPTAYLWPRLPHSVKPEQFYALVEEASPGPYLEMFARSNRLGWDAWGKECTSVILDKDVRVGNSETLASAAEAEARNIAKQLHGSEGLWELYLSEAYQRCSGPPILSH